MKKLGKMAQGRAQSATAELLEYQDELVRRGLEKMNAGLLIPHAKVRSALKKCTELKAKS